MVGMRDVAKKAGVSLSTVSAVLSNSEKYVSDDVRGAVLFAAAELGYKLPLKKKGEKTIAVLLPMITSVFFSRLLSGIEAAAAKQNYTLLFGSSDFQFEREKNYLSAICKQSLAGVIIDSVCPHDEEEDYMKSLNDMFVSKGIPVVFLERNVSDLAMHCVFADHTANAQLAVTHLLDMGHIRIAHISGSLQNVVSLERLNGYKTAIKKAGLSIDEEIIAQGDFTPSSGYIAMKSLLAARSDFTAVFAANDQMAIGAIKAILSDGYRIPEDIAVVGIDNLSVSSMIAPSLTTVNVPTFQMGNVAAQIIVDLCEGKTPERVHQFKGNLIIRKSSNTTATGDWELFGW